MLCVTVAFVGLGPEGSDVDVRTVSTAIGDRDEFAADRSEEVMGTDEGSHRLGDTHPRAALDRLLDDEKMGAVAVPSDPARSLGSSRPLPSVGSAKDAVTRRSSGPRIREEGGVRQNEGSSRERRQEGQKQEG